MTRSRPASAKEEILTYAYAQTSPEVYGRWGTFPPSAMLMIDAGGGKSLLAEYLAARTETAFVRVDVPRMVLDVIHGANKIGELVQGWSLALEERPGHRLLRRARFHACPRDGQASSELPIGPIMDLLFELIDRSLEVDECLVIGSTSHPDTLPKRSSPGPLRAHRRGQSDLPGRRDRSPADPCAQRIRTGRALRRVDWGRS